MDLDNKKARLSREAAYADTLWLRADMEQIEAAVVLHPPSLKVFDKLFVKEGETTAVKLFEAFSLSQAATVTLKIKPKNTLIAASTMITVDPDRSGIVVPTVELLAPGDGVVGLERSAFIQLELESNQQGVTLSADRIPVTIVDTEKQRIQVHAAQSIVPENTSVPISVQAGLPTVVPVTINMNCLLYTSPSPRDRQKSRMPSSA